jgi:hypothetical protein
VAAEIWRAGFCGQAATEIACINGLRYFRGRNIALVSQVVDTKQREMTNMATCTHCGQTVSLFSKYHKACFLEAEKNRNLAVKIIRALIEVATKDKQFASEVPSRLNNVISRYKLTPEVVGQTVLGTVDDLSKEEPLETTAAECLFQLCENILGKPETILSGSPFHPAYHIALLNVALSNVLWLVMQGKKPTANQELRIHGVARAAGSA